MTEMIINIIERPITLYPNECKNRIRFLNGTDNIELNHFNYNNSFSFFEDPSLEKRLETVQTHFKTDYFNREIYGSFTYSS